MNTKKRPLYESAMHARNRKWTVVRSFTGLEWIALAPEQLRSDLYDDRYFDCWELAFDYAFLIASGRAAEVALVVGDGLVSGEAGPPRDGQMLGHWYAPW